MTPPDHELLVDIAGTRVLFVMAVAAEYGDHLRKRFNPLFICVGPVEAAINSTAALISDRPGLVVSLGSAGSARLPQAGLYQVSGVAYRDMDASPLGFQRGCTPFADLPARLDLPLRIPGLPEASLSTGGNIVSGGAYESIAEDMVDMETFAHLRAAQHFDIPLIGLRGISDGAQELRHLTDWTQYLHLIDAKLAGAVDRLERALSGGALRL